MELDTLLHSKTETSVVYRYLDMLAERTLQLEQRIELREINRLRVENQQLREQLANQNARPNLNTLLEFLPVIYRNFWNTVTPADIALLARTTEPELPPVVSEPTPAVVDAMKKRFLQLPAQERAQLLAFCRQLPHQLTIRESMKKLMAEPA